MLKVVRSKRYPEDISKDKGKNLLSENLRRTLKSLMGRGARERGGDIANDRKLLTTQYCKYCKSLKYFNMIIPYSFLCTRKFSEYLFPKGVFIYLKQRLPGVGTTYFFVNKYWGVVF